MFGFVNHSIKGIAGVYAMIRFVRPSMILPGIVILLFLIYSVLILYCWKGWNAIPEFAASELAETTVSVIIPARNEEENIGQLLQTLQHQTYPKPFSEIIVVDDHSTDQTATIVKSFEGVALWQMQTDILNSYKKKAIETGIANTNGELIVTTDADCVTGPDWLKTIAAFQQERNAAFIAAPVCFFNDPLANNKILLNFQLLDFLVLQGITGAAVNQKLLSMCNGANLAYERTAFYEVNGFGGIDHIASGDDMLLMHKIRLKYPDRIHYIKSKAAIVTTKAPATWKEFFNQRIRWASKANKYEDRKIFWVLLLVYLFNFSFLVLSIAGCWNFQYWLWASGFLVLKTLVELPFVISVAGFFGYRFLLKYFLLFQPLHIFYTIVAGWLGQFGSYEWKGRKVK